MSDTRKNHKFEVRLSMDGNVIASRARWVDEYPESVVYSLRLNKLMNDMCDLVSDTLRENDIERAWGIMEGFESHVRQLSRKNANARRSNTISRGQRITK